MLRPGQYISWKDFFKELRSEYKTDKVNDVAGSVTFFAMLAIFPFILFAVTLAGLIIEPEQAELLVQQLGRVAPPDVTNIFGGFVHSVAQSDNAGLLTASIIGALWTASGGVVALMNAMNTAYDVEERRPFWKVRLIAVVAVFATALFMLLAVAIVVAIPALANALGGGVFDVLRWLRLPIAGVLIMLLWACLYYFLPDVQQRFHFITFGSVVGVAVWLLASWGFSLYVQNFGKYQATYGALGGVIVLLLWMWLTSQVLLLGAEMNAILEHTSPEGKRAGAKRQAESGASTTRGEERAGGGGAGERPLPAPAEGGIPAWQARLAAAPAHRPPEHRPPAPRTRVGPRRKKVGKLELAVLGVVALRALRRNGRGRQPGQLR